MRRSAFGFWLFVFVCLAPKLYALNEVIVEKAQVLEVPAGRYDVKTAVRNQTSQPREVTVRAQVFFFDKLSPQGDKPVMILRQDKTIVIKPRERRKIKVRLINEGSMPKERLRLEPEVRLRRQRVWNY